MSIKQKRLNIIESGSPLTLTAVEQSLLSAPQAVNRFGNASLSLDIDINDSTGLEITVYGLQESGGTEFNIPIKNITLTEIDLIDGKYTFPDADNKYIFEIALNNNFAFLDIKAKVGTVGGTAGQINEAWLVLNEIGV
jgi:hypothetical protein